MKKPLLFFLMLTIAVFSSACINNAAIRQLNKIASSYLEEGDMDNAIARLESSVDLDGNIYETRYNLAVSYINVRKCHEAYEQIKVAKTLTKNEPAIYYLEGLANNCIAEDVRKLLTSDDEEKKEKKDIPKLKKNYIKYLEDANTAYENYMQLAPVIDNKDEIVKKIAFNKEQIQIYR